MTTFNYSLLANGSATTFNPNVDVLVIDGTGPINGSIGPLIASLFDVSPIGEGANAGRGITLRQWDGFGGTVKTIELLFSASPDPMNFLKITSSNITFASGARLLVGDNTSGVVNDDTTTLALNGSTSHDQLISFGGSQTLDGGDGNDRILTMGGQGGTAGGSGTDVLIGGFGFDTLALGDVAGMTRYTVNLALGTGSVAGANPSSFTVSGFEAVDGSIAENHIIGDASGSNLFGGEINDTIMGGGGIDYLFGRTGNDILDGGTETDTLRGDGGNDTLIGGAGDDFLFGNDGADTQRGGGGNDWIAGDNGNDTLSGEAGDDTMTGGAGIDTVSYQSGSTAGVTVNLATTAAQNTGGSGSDTLSEFERVTGSAYADRLTGTVGNNVLSGLGGNDTLTGSGGNDTLTASIGNDILRGGAGKDMLTGGTGLDKFDFIAALSATTNVDRITDFSVTDDQMRLDNDYFTAFTQVNVALTTAAFNKGAGMTTAQDASDRIIYNTTNGNLYYDADGTGAGTARLFATLTTHPGTLTAADFFIVA